MSFAKTMQRALGRFDGWANILTGIGTSRDKRTHAHALAEPMMHREEMEAIWRGDDMAGRCVETWPSEMTREGWDINIQDDDGKQAAELLTAKTEDLGAYHHFKQALEWERAYGGAAILIGANDGATDLRMPLREDSIESVDWLTTMAAYELHPVSYYSDPQAPKFGMPMIYQIHPDAPAVSNVNQTFVQVHESRLIHFPGIIISRRQQRMNNGWGDSVFIRLKKVLRDFDQTWASAAVLLQDFSQAVLKIKDLADLVATDQDNVVVSRAQLIDMQRSVGRMVMIDAEEDFERKPTPMSGFPEMMQQFSLRLAAAADMPVTLLLGQSPAGLNATGASDIRFFYDRVRAKQNNHLRPRLKRLVELLMLAQDSPTMGFSSNYRGVVRQGVPENWSIDFRPLWQMDEKDKAAVRLQMAQADGQYLDRGVISPNEIAVSRFGGDCYSIETKIDTEGRSAMSSANVVPEKNKERPEGPIRTGEALVDLPTSPAGGNVTGGINGGPT